MQHSLNLNEAMRYPTHLLFVTMFCLMPPLLHAADTTVTFRSLLREIVDRDRLPQLPLVPYVAGQASSYDRASVAPGQPGWFANHDFGMYVRTETNQARTEYVMMDVGGPGAIVRWWEGDHDNDAVNRHPGYVTNTRTRSLDAIPFTHHLAMNLEIWHWEATTMEYAATTYWYARPGAICNRAPDAAEANRPILMETK